MLQEPGLTTVRWTPPAWARSRTIVENAVEHCRLIGNVKPLDPSEAPITVEVVQREEFDLADPAFIVSSSPQIRVAGIRLGAPEARRLARQLTSAAALIGRT